MFSAENSNFIYSAVLN